MLKLYCILVLEPIDLINVIQGDVRKPPKDKKYELVFWWHGPEYIHRNELNDTIEQLETIATKYIILGCPWGVFKQGELDNNPYEKHVTHWTGEEFEQLGFKIERLRKKDKRGSNITAVKTLD